MRKLEVNDVVLAFVDRGAGPPVVLVHGFPLDHTMWDAQVSALEARCRVIVPDLRGFGQSGVTEGTVGMEQFADDVAGLLDALQVAEPIVLVGLSMGGYVALQFQRKHGSRLRGMVFCDTRSKGDSPQMAAGRGEMADRVLREGPAPLVDAMTPKLFPKSTTRDRPELVERLRRVMLQADPRGIAAAARGMAARPDMTAELSRIRCPTLVLVGELDVISPVEEMRAMAEAIPGSRFVEIPGCGHMTPIERPAEFNAALLKFLDAL